MTHLHCRLRARQSALTARPFFNGKGLILALQRRHPSTEFQMIANSSTGTSGNWEWNKYNSKTLLFQHILIS